MSLISTPVSFGELIDKITILEIKSERIADPAKLDNVRRELELLRDTWHSHPASQIDIAGLQASLKQVNQRLWVIEDDIRIHEQRQLFDAMFIKLARSVYFENDERAALKRQINQQLGSTLVEEKSYQDYGSARPA
jgi:hypothetical protein